MLKSSKSSRAESLEALLARAGWLTPEQTVDVHMLMTENGVNYGTAVMYLGLVSGERLASLLASGAGIRQANAVGLRIGPGVKNLLLPEMAKTLQVFPLGLVDDSGVKVCLLGMTDPLDLNAITKVQSRMAIPVQPFFLSLEDLQALYKKFYRSGLAIYPAEGTSSGERTVSRRLDSLSNPATPLPTVSPEVRALVDCLIEKGLLTEAEFLNALGRRR